MKKGYTYLEVLIVIAISGILLSFVVFNLFKTQHIESVNSSVSTLLSDMKNQQTKAMVGADEGRVTGDSYGIYFKNNSYVLFHGGSYNAQDSANFTVTLDQNLAVSATFPQSQIIFSQISGEILGFSSSQNTIIIQNTAGPEQKTITVNRYGVVTGVN